MRNFFISMFIMMSVFVANNVFAAVNADTLDTLDSTAFEGVKANVKYVAKAGFGTYSTVHGAINSITDASASKPYIVKVMPGIYNEGFSMKSYVSLAGAGADATIIVTSGITFNNVSNTEMSGFSIENSTGSDAIGIDASSPIIRNNKFVADYPIGVSGNAQPIITENIFQATSMAIWSSGASPIITRNKINILSSNEGIRIYSGDSVVIKDNLFVGNGSTCTAGIYLSGTTSNTTNLTISGNIIRNLGCYGIRGDGSNLTISGNIIKGNTVGIRTGSATIINNEIVGNTSIDIDLTNSVNLNFNVFDTIYGMTPSSLNVHPNGSPQP